MRDVSAPADAAVTMLGVPGALEHKVEGNVLTITMPELGPEGAPCRHAFVLKIAGAKLLPEQ